MSENPPAFPAHGVDQGTDYLTLYPTPGMTLRDYFAGQALAGYVAHVPWDENLMYEFTAEVAYELADAMLKEREKKA